MKKLNLRAVGEKITAPFYKLYNVALNKIAIHSELYKSLYNRFELDIELHKRIFEFVKIIETNKTTELLTNLYKTISPGVLEKFDYQVIRLSEPYDILIVSSDIEKQRVKNAMSISAGAGEVLTIDEVLERFYELPAQCSIYIFSSVWVKEQTKLVNLLYKINSDKEKYSL